MSNNIRSMTDAEYYAWIDSLDPEEYLDSNPYDVEQSEDAAIASAREEFDVELEGRTDAEVLDFLQGVEELRCEMAADR